MSELFDSLPRIMRMEILTDMNNHYRLILDDGRILGCEIRGRGYAYSIDGSEVTRSTMTNLLETNECAI